MWTYAEISPATRLALLALAVFLAIKVNPRDIPWLAGIRRGWRRLAARPWLACGVIVAVGLGLNVSLAMMRYPLPWVHDEFSYLLASDTFAHGHLTNPRHPMWEHFETFHVISDPSYMSKYPPASGMFMAAGQWMTGHPVVGVWMSLMLACAAMYWMLRAWTSPQWAMTGGLLIAASAPLIRAWGQTYWGGSVALLGGALVFGGLRRICSAEPQPKIRDALALGAGMVLLANSRPLEGFLVCIPVTICLVMWFLRSDRLSWPVRTRRIVLPIAITGMTGLIAMAAYNHRVTGDVWLMPYKHHDRTYSASSLVAWRPLPEIPEYRHPRMEQFYLQWGRDRQTGLQTASGYVSNLGRKFTLLWNFLPIGIGLSLVPVFWFWRSPWWRLATLTVAGVVLVHTQLATSWMYPHYLAPVVALFLAINVECLRRLSVWQRENHVGQMLARMIVIVALLKLVPMFIDWQKEIREHPRQQVTRRLADDPAPRHLVIVSYGDDYRIVDDWVYNRADIDASPIVWARDMGQSKNEQLIEYFHDRKVWRWQLNSDDDISLQAVDAPEFTLTTLNRGK